MSISSEESVELKHLLSPCWPLLAISIALTCTTNSMKTPMIVPATRPIVDTMYINQKVVILRYGNIGKLHKLKT